MTENLMKIGLAGARPKGVYSWIMFYPIRSFLFLITVAGMLASVSDKALAQGDPLQITISKAGAKKDSVSLAGLRASGANGQLFVQTLKRDLDLSGWFKLASGNDGTINVVGALIETGSGIQSSCKVTWPGKNFNWARTAASSAEVRQAAHALADEIVKQVKNEKGMASTRIVFINRRGSNNGDVYVCDADGGGMYQVTHDSAGVIGPQWGVNRNDLIYTSLKPGYPMLMRQTIGGSRRTLANFKGLNTGGAISPEGRRIALILSYQGNAELYVLDFGTSKVARMTNTPQGAESSPCWSPDGRSIVYVSDTAKSPQLYVVDVESRASKRLTFKGSQNVNPSWSSKGKICYATLRGGIFQIAMMNPTGDASSEIVPGQPEGCEDPSWAVDGRHIICSARNTLYILDTLGDPAVRLINATGNWRSPDWSK
jgi:TolB protein